MDAMGNGKDGESKENSALRSVWSTCACSSAVEHLVYTQRVGSSKLSARTKEIKGLRKKFRFRVPQIRPSGTPAELREVSHIFVITFNIRPRFLLFLSGFQCLPSPRSDATPSAVTVQGGFHASFNFLGSAAQRGFKCAYRLRMG